MYELSITVFLGIMPALVIGSTLHSVNDTGGARWHFNTVLLLAVPLTIAMFGALRGSDGPNLNFSAAWILLLMFLGIPMFVLATLFYAAGRLKAPNTRVGYDVFAWVTGTAIVGSFAWLHGLFGS